MTGTAGGGRSHPGWQSPRYADGLGGAAQAGCLTGSKAAEEASTTVGFLAAQLREFGCRSALIRVGWQPTQTGHQIAEIESREAVTLGCSVGRGTNAASRCMYSSFDMTRCVVPSRQAVFNIAPPVR